jgi:hypothetical protein
MTRKRRKHLKMKKMRRSATAMLIWKISLPMVVVVRHQRFLRLSPGGPLEYNEPLLMGGPPWRHPLLDLPGFWIAPLQWDLWLEGAEDQEMDEVVAGADPAHVLLRT